MQTGNTSILGRYEILGELGRGAMGIVYKAYDPRINRVVAIKTISRVAGISAEEQAYRARFFGEAEAAGRLSHPRIVPIFDIGESPETLIPYIVMEYIAGRSLEEILSSEGASLPLGTILQLTQEVAEALDYAHLQGVVHRDVKPSNIIIGADGHAKIADFGIAQLNTIDTEGPGHTWGTPAYMSPEQFRGEAVDGRSDVFSLGVILYRMLTGHRPFQGNSALTVALRVQKQDPVPATVFNTELSPELDAVIARAIAKNPAERYQTGMEMVLDLQRLRDGIEFESRLEAVFREPSHRAQRAPESSDRPRSHSVKNTDESPPQTSREPAPITKTRTPTEFTRPGQQLGIAFLGLVFLLAAFAGLWWAIPTNSIPGFEELAFHPVPTVSMATVLELEQMAADSSGDSGIELPAKNRPRKVDVTAMAPGVTRGPLRSCQLGIAVEHHFVTADISVWIDNQASYSHSLRGAIRKRVVLFKGVEGYLSDVVQLSPGEHQIRVRVLSADGAYDESGSISGTFTSGSNKLLAVDFDRHNRHMRLTFEAKKDF